MHTLRYNFQYISVLGSVTSLEKVMKKQLRTSVNTFKESRETDSYSRQRLSCNLNSTLMPTLQEYGTMKTTKIVYALNLELDTFLHWVDVPSAGAPNFKLELYSAQPKQSILP